MVKIVISEKNNTLVKKCFFTHKQSKFNYNY